MSTYAIIQARMGATRLPNKVLMTVEGRTILEHVINRLRAARNVDDVIVATTVKKEDLGIVKLCANLGVSVFCGSENDILDRYYQAARLFKVEDIVRITADCPLLDPNVIDSVIDLYFKSGADYGTNLMPESFPDGEDVEVLSFNTLEKVWKIANMSSEREHVTSYIRKKPDTFKIANLEYKPNLKDTRWTLDNPQDLEFIKTIYKNLYPVNPLFGMEEVLTFLKEHPEVEKINQNIIRDEGWLKSLKEDKVVNLE